MSDTILALALVLASFLTALAALVAFAVFYRLRERRLVRLGPTEKNAIVFLFEDDQLADSTQAAKRVLQAAEASGDDWARLASILKPRFEGFDEMPMDALEHGPVEIEAKDGTSRLMAEVTNGMLRLEISDGERAEAGAGVDRYSLAAMRDELATHRAIAEHVPFLTWRENAMGETVWANRAYLKLAEIVQRGSDVAPWPPAQLFGPGVAGTDATGTWPQRARLRLPDEGVESWFEVHRAALGDETLFTATPIDALIRVETSLSEFISTLTGTFAHLPIGLAIFDQHRKLSLFNPALTDLTMLPAEFLCSQPSLFAFLDRLRDKRMMPEPKDYKGWRQAMSELEEKAINGTYMETWFLPTGQTYRVTGQPHPGGALALLFEDISSEMSLTHRFKAELEMGQAVLDGLQDAVAVFTAGGILSMTNAAFSELWDTDPSTSMTELTVSDATFSWGQRCNPTPVWRQLRAFIPEGGERRAWEAPVTLKDGRVLNCRIIPTVQGATMVTFAQSLAAPTREAPEQIPVRANI